MKEIDKFIQDNTKDNTKSAFHRMIDDIKWEIEYWWQNSIVGNIKSFFRGIENLKKWRHIIWNDRWWDHSFMLEILHLKLKTMEENWGSNTHYVGDLEDKESLKKLVEDLEWMIDPDNEFIDGYDDEYKKVSKRFFGRLDRNHRKFWD